MTTDFLMLSGNTSICAKTPHPIKYRVFPIKWDPILCFLKPKVIQNPILSKSHFNENEPADFHKNPISVFWTVSCSFPLIFEEFRSFNLRKFAISDFEILNYYYFQIQHEMRFGRLPDRTFRLQTRSGPIST